MNTLAYKIALMIKRANPEQTHSVEVMNYALGIILNTMFIIVISGLIGLITGAWHETMLFLCAFSILRLCSGGFHMKTARACNVISILLCTITPYFSSLLDETVFGINLFCLTAMILFAPQPDIHSQIPKKLYPTLKILSVLLVGSNFVLNSSVIGLAFLAQSLTVIFAKREERS
ncbi:accessory gene regulator ArgB-like protein [Paenibacillus sp. sgz500958]|uniref:accessory gene regulator ArgB-like protein n=1 Tax=Paenibacillus sp. sgz500958 TaxID=3242475 RepID=UPI0036D3DD21